ncbi:D-aminoacyl-tRNA deacylase, partial [Flavonifractor sp. An52]|uniref:D-aminoacyl-tRNA deacylase n=2 Tax=unclassified Flavonifractor TaxID=2629267 RepID=UPI001FA82B96
APALCASERFATGKTSMPGGFTPPEQIKRCGVPAGPWPCGGFGADMQVYSQNDGPVTILLDTDTM